jgi:CRP-like cAMP-binding protein
MGTSSNELSQRVALLGGVPLFAGLTPPQLEGLAKLSAERIVSRGFYMIMSGAAEVRRSGRSVASLLPGQFFGESALLRAQPRTADVYAVSEVRCLTLDRKSFWEVLGIDPNSDPTGFEAKVLQLRESRAGLTE